MPRLRLSLITKSAELFYRDCGGNRKNGIKFFLSRFFKIKIVNF